MFLYQLSVNFKRFFSAFRVLYIYKYIYIYIYKGLKHTFSSFNQLITDN